MEEVGFFQHRPRGEEVENYEMSGTAAILTVLYMLAVMTIFAMAMALEHP